MNATAQRLIRYIGTVKLSDFKDPALAVTVDTFCKLQEKENPEATQAEIKGTKLHYSHDDPDDPEKVISIRFKNDDGRRLGTGHVHEDGTGKVAWK